VLFYEDDSEEWVGVKVWDIMEQYAKQKVLEGKNTMLESIHNELHTKLEYFSDMNEWNQDDRFIQGRKRSLENAKQIVRKYIQPKYQ
jgi:hypothetical protein